MATLNITRKHIISDLIRLTNSINAVTGEWDTPFVELAIFDTRDAAHIAEAVNAIAYTVRCENCLDQLTGDYPPGSYRELLARDGEKFLPL